MKSFRLLFALAALLLAAGTHPTHAQRYEWLQPFQNAYFGTRSATDAAGNTYVAGYYYDSLVTTAGTLHGADRGFKQGAYVAKISPSGVVKWLRDISTDSSVGVICNSLSLDGQGHLYLTGGHGEAAHFGSITMPGPGVYLAKYDTAGTALWVKDLQATVRSPARGGFEVITATTDEAGNCFLSLRASYVNTLEGFPLDRRGSFVSVIAKCAPDGTVQWIQQLINPRCSPNNPNTWFWELTADNQGNCLAVGQQNNETTFGTGPNAPTRLGCRAFVVKYSAAGGLDWVQSVTTSGSGFGVVKTDAAGNCYVGGRLVEGPLLDPLPAATAGAAVLKLDPTGTPLWLRQEAGDPNAYCSELAVEAATGAVLAAGVYVRTCTFGPHQLIGTGGGNTFIVRYDAQGTPQQPMATAGSLKAGVYPMELTLDGANNVYLTGALSEVAGEHFSLNFGPFSYGNTNASNVGGFVVKLNQQVNFLTGQVYLDANANGQHDMGEVPFPRSVAVIESRQQQLASSSVSTGRFTAFAGRGPYGLRVLRVPPHYRLTQGSTGYSATFTDYAQTDTARHFGLVAVANQPDVRVTLTAYRPARRGIPTKYRARLENVGTTAIASGQVTVRIDAAATIVGTVPVAQAQGQVRTWNFTDLAPFATRDYDLIVNLPLNVAIGTSLASAASASTSAGVDVDPRNNADTLRQVVVGSFDPNELRVSYSTLTQAQVAAGEPLDYVVCFENLGTDTAFAVVIQDTLPASLLQLGTVELMSQSHNVEWMLSRQGLLTMRFPLIRLPQQAVDAVRSQGFVRFRIVPRTTLTVGTLILNRAHISFDFNPPIVTNQVTTLVQAPNGLVAATNATPWSLYPNPATGTGHVVLTANLPATGTTTVTIVDALGQLVRTEAETALAGAWQHNVPTTGLTPGVYAVRLTLPGGVSTSRRLVVR